MSKEILRFRGLSLNRDEQSAEHGELSLCAGVELHDGALRPSVLEGSMVENKLLVDGNVATMLYVHETASYRHFIGMCNNKMYWFDKDGTLGSATPIHEFNPSNTIESVSSVGNTLIVMAQTGVYYIHWKEGNYKYLGSTIPYLSILFGLSANHKAKYDRSTIDGSNPDAESYLAWRNQDVYPSHVLTVNGQNVNINGDSRSWITEMAWALINRANDTIVNDGHFYAPFLIRYCYRLYDGSMVMHSAPVYMNVSSPKAYRVYCANVGRHKQNNSIYIADEELIITDGEETFTVNMFTLCYQPNNVNITYRIPGTDESNTIIKSLKEDWSDIVKSIDIFVSPMMAPETQGKEMLSIIPEKSDTGVRRDRLYELKSSRQNSAYYLDMSVDIPMQDEEAYMQRVKDNSLFYKIKSFNLSSDTVATNDAYIDLKYDKNAIVTLTSQEQMKDDYHTHYRMFPSDNKGMFVYNHRLNLYGMQEQLFSGFPIPYMINNYDEADSGLSELYSSFVNILGYYIEISTEYGKKYVGEGLNVYLGIAEYAICKSLLFYPDSRASKMILYYEKNSVRYKATLNMEPHNFLNGAIVTSLFNKTEIGGVVVQRTDYPVFDDLIPMFNKVITSEADNPYYFPVEGRNTVGLGNIKGIAAVTRALSQGQVGDHDLAVFSTDGIWVMKVSGEGTYGSVHNISREVCSNPKSICQLDQSVVFATQRSLSRFVESDVVSMTDMLDGPVKDWSSLFGDFFEQETDGELITRQLQMPTPVEMFNTGRMLYDYTSARILVFPADTSRESVAFVFSVRDQTWSTMVIPAIKAMVPGYPSPFVQYADGEVRILDKTYDYSDTAGTYPGLILTRTLTFSETMDVIQGFRQYADCENAPMLFFYGSNDQRSWQVIGQSGRWFYNYMSGKSYRFFKVAVYMKLRPSQEYQQLVLDVVNKYGKL